MNQNQLLYVENISPSSSEEHLVTYLEKWAPVQQVYFLREKQCTKRSIAAFVRVANEADLDLLLLRNQQNYRGKRLFMVRVDQTPFFQADHTVIVRNITFKISEENLYDHFEDCGKIAFLQIRTDDFAYIGFEDKSSVRNAMSKNNVPLKGSNLKIQLLTRNIEIMIVNLDTLQARMPDLYRKMIIPIEPRKPGVVPQQQQQQQQPGNQQQHSQPAKQQPGNQQQQSQTPKQQQQQQHLQPAKQQFGNQQQQYSQPSKQQFGNQQQQSQPPKQQQQYQPRQQTGNQQQQNQRQQQPQQQQQQRGQPYQQKQPQQQPQPQRQQQKQPQPQQQQVSTIQLLKEKANAFAEKQQQQQQPQQKPPQQAPAVQPAKPTPPVQEQPKKQEAVTPVPPPAPVADSASEDTDDVQIIEPMETTEILDDESDSEIQIVGDTSLVPPIPSAYKPQPGDIMRPVKASEIEMSVVEGKTERDNRSVWVNNIQPETGRLTLVMYMEQFGDVETCKLGTSKNCYFTQWAKVCFTTEEAAKRATEYFLHPFQGRYLFVLACNRCIDEVPGKVFVLDYLSKYLVYEDVAKSLKPVGEVFYLVRILDNTYKVRIYFLDTVDVNAAQAVKSIGGMPINVTPYGVGTELKIPNDLMQKLRLEREVMDAEKEARMAKILEIYKEGSFDRCDPVVNPDGTTEDNVVLMSNVHSSTTNQQINAFFKSIGQPTFIRREKEPYNEGYERVYVGFRTLSMVLKATELPADKTLNDCKPFIFAACTKPHMSERNTVRMFFASKEITVQDIYNGLIHFGKIRYIEKEHTKKALIVWDSHDNGINNCNISKGFFIGPVLCLGKEDFYQSEDINKKSEPWFTEECTRLKAEVSKASRLQKKVDTLENRKRLQEALLAKGRAFNRLKKRAKRQDRKNLDNYNEYDGIEEYVNMLQKALDDAHRKPTENELLKHRADMSINSKSCNTWFDEECNELVENALRARRRMLEEYTPENKESFKQARALKAKHIRRLKLMIPEDFDTINEYDTINRSVNLFQALLDQARGKSMEKEVFQHRADMNSKSKTFPKWFNEECNELIEKALRARRRMLWNNTPENIECFRQARLLKTKYIRQLKQMMPEDFDSVNEYDTIDESVNLFQTLLDKAHEKPTEKEAYVAPPKVVQKQPEESIVIDDEDEVVEVSNDSPTKTIQPANQNKKQPNEKNQPNHKNPQNRQQQQQQQQQQRRGPPQQQQQERRQQQHQQQQRPGRDRNRNPFADNRSPQRPHPFQQQQQQQQDQRRSMNAWGAQDNQGPMWNDQQQQFLRQQDQFMPDDRFNRNNDGPFDRFDQGGRNMNQFEQMMLQQFGNFSMNQQNDNGFNRGPMDSDDPPLDRRWGHQQQQQQQQRFNRFSPPRQRSPFGRDFRDDASPNFGRDSPGIPPNIPEDEIDEYILRKQESIKRRLEQLDKQLITSVESSRHRDYELAQRRRKGTVFSDNGDVHYVPNPAAVARNRERRGGGAGRGRGSGSGRGRRDREENLLHRQRDPFADVDIVPIIRISEERSPSPKRNRDDDAFDTAQFDAAWS